MKQAELVDEVDVEVRAEINGRYREQHDRRKTDHSP